MPVIVFKEANELNQKQLAELRDLKARHFDRFYAEEPFAMSVELRFIFSELCHRQINLFVTKIQTP